jgi:aquaporin Z
MNTARHNYPEYLMEAPRLGLLMIMAAVFTTLLQHPASPLRQAIADPLLRRFLIGDQPTPCAPNQYSARPS